MTPEEFQRVDTVFQRAVAMRPPDRSRYLDDTCDGEPNVRARVESLLARDSAPHHLLAFEPRDPEAPPADIPAPAMVGPYRILDVLGSGAMGVVYRAEQENPRRLVALKLMRGGFSSAQGLRRFRQEAELLGRLKHPGVASIIEAGTTSLTDGAPGDAAQPYFVMELVDGRPLLEYVRHHELTVRARVELIVRICDAVEHAHLSGIVHRDLKPANILVTEGGTTSSRSSRDASPVGQPKVLDFGVARIMDADRAPATVQTSAGELVGTLPYMSPEQIGGDQDAVDTRSDVYALGVILFEVLTGRRPHDVSGKSIAEAARIICEEAATPLRAIDRHLRGDLDTIVATAIEKDVTRRYDSVAQLAGDLRRYLADEPILARPPTTLYQLSKFARRNRGLVTGVVAALVILIAGLMTSAALYARAEQRAELMRRALYVQRITLGQNAIESGDVREVAAILEACPSDLRHWEWRRLRLLADDSERVLRGHTGNVNDIAFSGDERFVATAGGYDHTTPAEDHDRTVRIWEVETGVLVRVIDGHANSVQSLAFSPDGRTLATVSRIDKTREEEDGALRFWDLETGALRGEIAVHASYVDGVRFTPDGRTLFIGGGRGTMARIDTQTRIVEWNRGEPDIALTGTVLTPDARFVVGSDWAGYVTMWDAETGDVRWESRPHETVVRSIAMSPDGTILATASKDRTVKLLDTEDGTEIRTLPAVEAVVTAVVFAPDGRLVTGTNNGLVRVYDLASAAEPQVLVGHEDAVLALAFSPGGAHLGSASRDGTARLWAIDASPADLVIRPHEGAEIFGVAWSPDSTRVVTAGGIARITDIVHNVEVAAIEHSWPPDLDWSDDGTRIVVASSVGEILVCDANTAAELVRWHARDDWIRRVAFSPDGALVASGGRYNLDIWDAETGALVHTLDPGETDVLGLAWSPDGTALATADYEGVVTLWDRTTGARLATISVASVALEVLAFHPNGKWIATGDSAGVVHLIDRVTGRKLYAVEVHAPGCEAMDFSPDGLRLVTGGRDGRVRLLESSSGDHVMTLKGHRDLVKAVAFSPDGKRIASTSRDATVRIWNAGPR